MLPIVILYIQCIGNDGDVIGNLDPMMYTLMVEAITEGNFTHLPQHASDVAGPVTLTGGSAQRKCYMHKANDYVINLNNACL